MPMKRVTLIATACLTLFLAVTLMTSNARAQDWNLHQRTYLTFSNAVELPGVKLQPGTYLFRLTDSQSNRHIIQVLSQDEKQTFATVLAVPAERLEVTGESVVTFRETAEGTTPAVRYWYYPCDRIGHEFVYPKEQAIAIAHRTNESVLSTEGEVSSNSTVNSVSPSGEVSAWEHERATPAPPATGQVQGSTGVTQQSKQTTAPEPKVPPTSTSATTESQMPTESKAPSQTSVSGTTGTSGMYQPERPVDTSARKEALPRTASPLPLSGLIGLLSLGGALAVRKLRLS
jgi:hypothetical protein